MVEVRTRSEVLRFLEFIGPLASGRPPLTSLASAAAPGAAPLFLAAFSIYGNHGSAAPWLSLRRLWRREWDSNLVPLNKINELGGANGIRNLHNSAKTRKSKLYWTLNGHRFLRGSTLYFFVEPP